MGTAVVDRLYQSGRNHRAQAGIYDSRLCLGAHSATSAKTRRGTSSSFESGQGYAAFESAFSGIRGASLRPECLSHAETLYPGTLSPHTQEPSFTCLWQFAAVRYRDPRSAALLSAEDGRGVKLGVLRSPAKLDVQDIHDREEMELLPGAQSCLGSGVTRKQARSRKACSDSATDRAAVGTSAGAMPNYGSGGIVDRSAGWRDSRPRLEGNRFDLRPAARRADHFIEERRVLPKPRAADAFCPYRNLLSGPCLHYASSARANQT